MTSEPIEIDALRALPTFHFDVPVRIRNTWRVRLAAWVLSLASFLLRSEVRFGPEFPPVVVFPDRMLSGAQRDRLIADLRDVFQGGYPGRVAVFDLRASVYQLVDGRWSPLHVPHENPDV
jgi:hypothetical protein